MATQTDRRVVIVDVQPGRGIAQVNRQMGRLNQTTLRMRDSLSRINTAFAAIGGAFTGRALTNIIDTFTEAEQRMSIFLGDSERAAEMVNLLAEAAQRSYANFDQVSTVMTRMLVMGKNLNATYGDFLLVTEGLASSFTLAGSTVMEATNAARQLVQGLGSGTLQGEELRAVLEQNALVAQRLADHFNVGVGELREMAAEGELASQKVFDALLAGSEEWIRTMENFTPSMRQSFAMLGSAFGQYINDVNKATGLTKAFGETVKWMTGNLGSIIGGLGAAMGGLFAIAFVGAVSKHWKNPLIWGTALAGIGGAIAGSASDGFANFVDDIEHFHLPRMLALAKAWSQDVVAEWKEAFSGLPILGDRIFNSEGNRQLAQDFREQAAAINEFMIGHQNLRTMIQNEGASVNEPPAWLREFAGTGGTGPTADQKKAAEDQAKAWADLKDELDPINAALAEYSEQLTVINKQTELGANLQAEYASRAKDNMLEAAGVMEVINDIDPTAAFVRQIEMLEQMMDAFPQYSEMIAEKILNVHEEMDAAIEGTVDKQKTLMQEVSTFVADQAGRMADAFVSFATDAEFTVSDMVEAMLKDLARLVIFQTITQPLATRIADALPGGSATIQEGLPAKAMGGPVSPGVAYTVGERGRETFIPNMAGRIIPNGGGGGTNVQVINNTNAEATTETTRQADGSELIRVIVGEVARDINSNGQIGQSIQSQYGSQIQGVVR